MTELLLYFVESTACLGLFYSVYYLFFRQETYFRFNRFYILAAVVLAQVIPLLNFGFDEKKLEQFSVPTQKIVLARTFYTSWIENFNAEWIVDNAPPPNTNGTPVVRRQTASNGQWLQNALIAIYCIGTLVFLSRFVYMLFWLKKLRKTNRSYVQGNIQIVEIKEALPSFSFFRTVYVHRDGLASDEFDKILTHEKAHIKQKHSVDLVVLQLVLLAQWFNPLMWKICKALKNTHEYLADRQVVRQGAGLVDYQSLLLSQLVSSRSVELVNNFNLLSTKKRIAMMNKTKSGKLAQSKALFAVPAIIIAILFFANITKNEVSASEKPAVVSVATENGIDLPVGIVTQSEIKTEDNLVSLKGEKTFVNHKEVDQSGLETWLKKLQKQMKYPAVVLEISKETKMSQLKSLHQTLRETNVLKLAYLVQTNKTGKFALLQKLPPLGAKEVDLEVLKKKGVEVLVFNTGDVKNKINLSKRIFSLYKEQNSRLMKYNYSSSDSFQNYLSSVDLVHTSVNKLREDYSQKHFKKSFATLPADKQKKIRKKFPIMLTIDCDE